MTAYYGPRDPIEEQLVYRIARCIWRLKYAEGIESKTVAWNRRNRLPESMTNELMRYERQVDIQLHRAIKALHHKRAEERMRK
jgi:hypothetical protein